MLNLSFFITLGVIFCILVIPELLYRAKKIQSKELSRKFIHITVGSFAAFWPYFLSWAQVELLSVLLLLGIIISRYFTIFHTIHEVNRKTWGDLLFAIPIGIVGLVTHSPLIYAVSILHMSIADGFAAITGTTWGKKHTYHVLHQKKTVVGTLTFYVLSLLLCTLYIIFARHMDFWFTIAWLPVVATFLENIGIFGTDNVLVPLVVAFTLKML